MLKPIISNLGLCAIAAILGLQICLILPLGVFIENSDEFNFGFVQIFAWALRNAAILGLVLLIPIFFLKPRGASIYNKILLTCVILFFLNSQFLIADYGTFDDRGITIDKFGINSLIQIFTVLAISIFIFGIKNVKIANFVVGSIVGLSFCISSAIFVSKGKAVSKRPSIAGSEFVKLSNKHPNVIHILLDEISGSSSKEILTKNTDLANTFEGFKYYDNTAAVFPTTIMSVPAMLSGKSYEDGALVDDFFARSFQNSQMLNLLVKNDYDIKLHTLNFYCEYFSEGKCSTAGYLGVGQKNPKRDYFSAINMGAFIAVPDLIKPIIYRDGNWLFGKKIVSDSLASDNQYFLDEFDFILDSLSVGSEKPNYRFFHTLLTHSPVKFDEKCKPYPENPERSYTSYLPQDECGLRLASKIIGRIKDLGIYDNTMIIISSDHGRPFVNENSQRIFDTDYAINKNSTANSWHYGYSHATLMVKPFDSKESFKMTDSPVSLLDIPFFVMAAVNNEVHSPLKERVYTYYKWSKNYWQWEAATLPPFDRVFSINGHISNPKDWKRLEKYRSALPSITTQKRKAVTCGYARSFTSSLPEIDVQGLSVRENWGRWSDGDLVKFKFTMPKNQCEESRIALSMLSYVNKKTPKQSADVFLNDTFIKSFTLTHKVNQSATIILDLPLDLLRLGGENTLQLRLKNATIPPQNIGQSNPRKLAFGFTSIKIY